MFEPLSEGIRVAVENAVNLYIQAESRIIDIWLKEIVFSWHWWFNTILSILPWAVWFFIRKKDSTNRLFYAGLAVIFIVTVLDITGMSLDLWSYNIYVLPIIPAFLPWDWTLAPVAAMIFYQYKPNINPWIKAVVYSLIASFIAQPFFTWTGCYVPNDWKDYYSVPIFILVYMAGYWFLKRKSFAPLKKD